MIQTVYVLYLMFSSGIHPQEFKAYSTPQACYKAMRSAYEQSNIPSKCVAKQEKQA